MIIYRSDKAGFARDVDAGKIDTILLEMEVVPEDRLTQYLSLATGLPISPIDAEYATRAVAGRQAVGGSRSRNHHIRRHRPRGMSRKHVAPVSHGPAAPLRNSLKMLGSTLQHSAT